MGNDLEIFQIHWLGFSIGAGFNISQNKYQKRYDDPQKWNCFCFVFYISGLQLFLTIPLWKV